MQQHIVFSTAEVAVQVVRRLALALDAPPGAHEFVAQPFLLAQVQRWRALQFLEQQEALGFVISGFEGSVALSNSQQKLFNKINAIF